jgi:sugar lactone lactonase YvrE
MSRQRYLRLFAAALTTPIVASVLLLSSQSQHRRSPKPVNTRRSPAAYRTSWLGNTFGGVNKWVQSSVEALYVAPDGTVFTNSTWDESGREAGVYRDGDAIANPAHTHGWGQSGGRAVTANRDYLYLAASMGSEGGKLKDSNTWPTKGIVWFGVSRRKVSDVERAAPFEGGKGGAGDTLAGSFLVINAVTEGSDAGITGLAADNNRLYISNPHKREVTIYDAQSMQLLGSFPVDRPAQLVLDHQGTLWIIQVASTSDRARILHFSSDGEQLPEQIGNIGQPSALALGPRGRLLIADAGPRQQVVIFDISGGTPAEIGTIGVRGGVYSGVPGEIANNKLASPIGVGADAAGNIYVAGTIAGSDIRKFSSSGKMIWRVVGLVFQDAGVTDPNTDAQDVYTTRARFAVDYTRSSGQDWSWNAFTIHTIKYPHDPRLDPHFARLMLTAYAIRHIQGQKFLYVISDNHAFMIYRFDGEIAVPSVLFAPTPIKDWLPGIQPQSRYIWRDINGDGDFQAGEFFDADGNLDSNTWGWDVDAKGAVWEANEKRGLSKFEFRGLDSAGNPIYTRGRSSTLGIPNPLTTVERVRYIAESDVMYLSGYTREHPKAPDGYWGQAGTEIVRYDNWNHGNREPRWRILLPYQPPVESIKAFTVAGQRLFAGLLASSGSSENHTPKNLYVYDAESGTPVATMAPGPEVGSSMGWIDLCHGLHAYKRSNGEYVVFMEEVAWGKVIIYRISGGSKISSSAYQRNSY